MVFAPADAGPTDIPHHPPRFPKMPLLKERITNLRTSGSVTRRLSVRVNARGRFTNRVTDHRVHHWCLVAPNNDVGVDGMVINLGGLLAGTATNPFGNGYYQGDASAPLEAASACPGVYAKGAYPGYAGDLLVESTTGASYNAHGTNGRKYLLPALYDPSTSTCSTLV